MALSIVYWMPEIGWLGANKWALAHLKIMLSTKYSLINHIYMCVCVCVGGGGSVYKLDLVLNNPQGLTSHKIQPNQTKQFSNSQYCCQGYKMTNYSGLRDFKLAWYSLTATWHICFYSLEYGLEIHNFIPTWSYLIVKVLQPKWNFLNKSGYGIVINCAFTLRTTNVFECFCGIIAQFKLVKPKFLN